MPIYAYRCESCGHAKDVLQKISDPLLTQCPACSADTFKKQLTAAGFQLKGSGWYVTDFRNGDSSKAPKPPAGAEGKDASKDGVPATDQASTAAAATAESGVPKTPAAAAPASTTSSTSTSNPTPAVAKPVVKPVGPPAAGNA